MALLIVAASLYYTDRLAAQLAIEEKKKVEEVADALKILSDPSNTKDLETAVAINTMAQNKTIPLIIADEKGRIKDKINIDSSRALGRSNYAELQLQKYRSQHAPIKVDYGTGIDYVYYGESFLLTQLRYFPYVQLAIIVLFLVVVLLALNAAHRSLQNQVWVGLSKETAHQMGTPLSSMEGWLELLRDDHNNIDAIAEMQNDLDRLKLVADRFGKVGSAPNLEEENLITRLHNMVAYMQKRSPQKVRIALHTREDDVRVNISGPLFDWVMENLIRNALDALAGQGNIDITVTNTPQQVWVDVQDTGKGIPAHQVKKVFTPGFTTKKRGWGLGLSLARRIITIYHHGSIFVKNSEVGKGTTFRIILRR
ncbi:HAMP domain-containing sensor histidine kinase [Nemorincola caseinilytica]|uniref:histidine kinase n=1 Tax=Nemorincola caseinilytica TaxID=2054315 RepID=A0ABP8N8G1_9BACT